MNANVINLVILINIWIFQIVSVKKINWSNDETKLVNITLAEDENNYEHSSCKVYIVLTTVVSKIFTGVTIYFVYYNWSLIQNNISCTKFNAHKETIIWWMQLKMGRIKEINIKKRLIQTCEI